MEWFSPGSPAPAGSVHHAGAPGSLSGGASLLRLLERARNVDEVEELVLAAAVHPEGAGFARAWLLRWDPGHDRLSQVRWALGPAAPVPIAECVQQLRSASPSGGYANGALDAFAGSIEAGRLDGVAAAAWSRGGIALGMGEAAGRPWGGPARGAATLHRGVRPHALLVGEWDGDDRIALRPAALEGLRQLAASGLDGLARAAESRRRAEQIAAVAELERAILSALNLAEALRVALRVAVRGAAANGGALWLTAPGLTPRLEVTHGAGGERETLGRGLQAVAEQVAAAGRACVHDDPRAEPLVPSEIAAAVAPLALHPLTAYGRQLGVIAVYGRTPGTAADPHGFDAGDREFLELIAALAALAVDQAQRFESQRAGEQERRELRARARRQDRLAAVGEMAVRVAEEVRNPLASIAAFARRARRDLPENHPHREYLEVVIREAESLEKRMRESFELVSPEPPSLKLESMNALVQDTLQACGETLVRRRIRLLKKLSPELPPLLLDGQRLRRVMHNIVERILDLVAIGGRIRVESRRVGEHVVVEIAHDGLHRPGDMLEELFEPFRSSRQGANGAGLTVAQQLVREHGGEIRLRSEGEWSTVLSITLPVPGNQDRRRSGRERRESRNDRRARPAAG